MRFCCCSLDLPLPVHRLSLHSEVRGGRRQQHHLCLRFCCRSLDRVTQHRNERRAIRTRKLVRGERRQHHRLSLHASCRCAKKRHRLCLRFCCRSLHLLLPFHRLSLRSEVRGETTAAPPFLALLPPFLPKTGRRRRRRRRRLHLLDAFALALPVAKSRSG